MRRSIMFAIASACAFAALSAPASARDHHASPYQERVSYADLDLSTSEGADQLLDRVNLAARNVCGMTHGRTTLSQRIAVRECAQAAADRAVARLGNPTVVARYFDRTGRSPPSIAVASANRS
jgi:UrcA family protein